MEKKTLQIRMTAKAVMIALLMGVVGMTKGYAQYLNGLIYNLNDNTFTATLVGHVNDTLAEGELNIPETVVFNDNTYTVTAIGASAFAQFTRLTSICIPNTVTIIGEYAFWNCCNATSINIPNAITTINEGTFGACGNLSSVSIPNTVITIGNEAFYGCNSLTSIDVPNSVTTIGDWAFHDCYGLVSVSIGNSVTAIGEEAFCWCSNLESVNFPNSLTSIGRGAFCGCSSLTSAIVIPSTVTSIQEAVFSGCSSLSSVVIPNSITTIGSNAFWGCESLTTIDIPNSVISIEMMAFGYCNGFTSFTIPNSVTFLGDGVFRDCINLSSVYIGSSVSEIEGRLFEGCINLAQIVVDYDNATYDSRNNCNAIIYSAENRLDAGCKTTIIPNTVTAIGYGAFIGCRGLASIEIPNSVTIIGAEAFAQCSGLTSINIPNSVTMIGAGAFSACINLNSIVIPNSVTSIDNAAFSSCNSFISIEIPNSVITLGDQVFEFCENLTSIVIPNSVTYLGSDAFQGCTSLVSVTLPSSITAIAGSTFLGCTSLVFVPIPNSVTSIGSAAFQNCTNLSSITFPNSVTSVGWFLFYGCSNLTSVNILANEVPSAYSNGYNSFPASNPGFSIYVPYESVDAYKNTTGWSYYADYIQPLAYTTISAYSESANNWRFIASPLAENTTTTAVENMITETDCDLYRFDQSEDAEWQNYKANNFDLENSQGYLYANAEDVNIIFKGEFNEDDTKTVNLVYDANADFAGWNLVGNPFPVSAYANKSYYTMNEDGTAIEPVAVSTETAIPACTGVMVKAENTGESVTFSKTAPTAASNNGLLQIAVAQSNMRGAVVQDKAVVSFNAGDELGKFYFGESNAKLYIPQNGKEYAIATAAKTGELLLNFKATKNGEYTISVNTENVELDYLHLIDNLTGADIDLLSPAGFPLCKGGQGDYTFAAKTTDYASRFKLVFSANESDGDNAFAFINNGNIIVYGEGTLQVIDMTGRVVRTVGLSQCGSRATTNGIMPGVYVLRLINGDNVMTQKIVVE